MKECQNTLKTWSGNTQIRENTYLLILAVYEACAQVVGTGVHLLMCEAELSHLPRPGSVKFVCLYLSLANKISKIGGSTQTRPKMTRLDMAKDFWRFFCLLL